MPKYKLSVEERAAKKDRKEQLQELMSNLDIKDIRDINTLFKEIVESILENGLDAEMDEELSYSKYDYHNKETDNSRNGHSKKTMKTSFGDVEINVPRDRNGEFQPQLIKKQQTTLTEDIEEKILSMYVKGMTMNNISDHIMEIYGLEVSDSTISRVTDKIIPVQERPLDSIYAVVFMDAIHYNVRCEGRIVKKAVYIAIGINMDGKKKY